MAHFSIISSQSGQEIFEGAPRYVGAYLKPGYLEFSEIGSPAAIDWHVGDYIVYARTGKTYRLYRTPQTVEQGNTQRYGAAFLYENVQFFDDSKQLEFCPFTDLVPGDNTIHFSTQNTVSFFGKPLNVAERLQACLEAQYGSGSWSVRIVSTTDADLLELLDTEVEFSVSGANCQQVLDKVYELWNGLGWIHSVENGVNVITIGSSNARTSSNTTVPFAYDNGLVRVERSIANADRIGTRLYAYGSMKNMDATYYRGLNIKDAESVDIEHLMIPLASWGLTDGLPDARKAYIENASAIASLGLIPRTAYFDGTGDLPDIFPTIERMTIGEVYDAGGAGYRPNLSKWERSQRIDEVVSASNPSDHGTSAEQGQKYAENFSSTLGAVSESFIDHDWLHATIYSATLAHGGKLTLRFGSNRQVFTLDSTWGPTFDLRLTITAGTKTQGIPLTVVRVSDTSYYTVLPETVTLTGTTAGALEVKVDGYIGQENDSAAQGGEGTFTSDPATTISGGVEYELDKTFSLIIPQIGFDIDNYADLGNGKTISMKTGMCAGRDFEIKDATYNSSSDSWQLTLYRSVDEDLNIMFPNADYQIAAGDQYVLLDIAMPEMYVTVASQRLLAAAQRLLSDISVEQPFFAPQIDAKVVYNESRVLREGMWMDVTFDSAQEYVLIDSITIDENGSNIPTYEVALREKKGLDWTENVGSSSSSRSSSSVNGSDQQQAAGTVTSVGMTVPEGMEVLGSPINSAGILSLQLKQGYIIPRVEDLGAYFQQNSTRSTLVELKSSYSYLGVKDGIFFSGATEADFEVQTINGQRVIHSRLPFYSDSFISAGGISDGGGSAGGNAILVAQTYGGTLSATGINPINFYSKEKVDELLLTAGSVRSVAGVSPVSGDIPVASLKSALGLGAAAAYGVGSVASGNTGLVTGGSVYSAINEAVSSVLKMQGTTTTAISDGSTTNPVVIDGSSYTAKKGDVVMYGNKEFWWTGSAWEELGDEASWALKTTTISAGTGLTGGGSLASNRTISLSQATIDSLALADTALQDHQTIYSLTIKNSAGTTQLTYTPNAGAGSITLTKAMVGLGNVENTALSTWAGTNKITTVGTIATGTWQGTAIGYNYVAAHYIGRTRTTASTANATLLGIDAISNAASSGSSDKSRIVWDSTNNAWHFLGNVYADGFVSAGGLSSGGGASGIDLAAMWASLTNSISDAYANTKIAAAHIPDMSGTYGYLKSGDISGVYLPLIGGTIKNGTVTEPLNIDSNSAGSVGMYFRLSGVNKAWVGYMNNGYGATIYSSPSQTYLGIKDDGTPHYQGNTLLHAANYTSYVNTTKFPGLDKVGTVTSVTLASGTNNGTLKLTVNGADTDNIAVKGLGSLAYKSSLVASDIPDISGSYLPKIGGTLQSANNNLLTLNNTASNPGGNYILFKENGTKMAEFGYWNTTYGAYIQNHAGTTAHTLSLRDEGSLYLDDYVVYHSGNANKNDISWKAYQITAWGSVYANRYQGTGNNAGASIVINKGGDYWGMGPSSSNVSVFAMGTTTNNTGTWKNEVVTITDAGAMTLTGSLTATTLTSTVATGTAPLTVSSTTVVSNLNADLLDGQQGSYYATASAVSTLQGYFTNGSAKAARSLASLGANSGYWYDTEYPIIAQWDDATHVRLKCTNADGTASYDVRVNAADKFVTARTLWGQTFDGTENVTGALSSVTDIDSLLYFDTTNSRVGVGKTPGYTFDVAGAGRFYGAMESSIALYLHNTTSAGSWIQFGYNNTVLGWVGVTSAYALAVQNAAGTNLLTVNTSSGNLSAPLASLGRNGASGLYLQSRTSSGTGYYNGANIVLNAPGTYYRGIGYNGYSDTLTIGPCSDQNGTWAASGSITLRVEGNIVATGAITAGAASDARLKTNIRALSDSDAKALIMALRPVTFTWNDKATELYNQYKGDDLGMIAQEVEPYLPQAVGTIFENYKRLDYTKVISPLVKVAQDHESRIRQLEAENRELRQRLNMN